MIVDKIKKREVPVRNKESNMDIPIGKWLKCDKCKEILYKDTVRSNLNICPNCGNYFRMHVDRRLEMPSARTTFFPSNAERSYSNVAYFSGLL